MGHVHLKDLGMTVRVNDDAVYPCDVTLPHHGTAYTCVLQFKQEHAGVMTALLEEQATTPGVDERGDPTLQFTVDANNPREAAAKLREILEAGEYEVGSTQYTYHTGIDDEGDPFVIMESPGDTDVLLLYSMDSPTDAAVVKALRTRTDLGIAKADANLSFLFSGAARVQFAEPPGPARDEQYLQIAKVYAALGE